MGDIRRTAHSREQLDRTERQTYMMRAVAALVLVGSILGACSNSDEPPEGPSAAETEEAPYGPGVEIERTYDYQLYVHCGIEWALIDGAWWQTPPLDDGNANPPEGWGNPYDEGELTLIDDMTATYAGPDGPVEFKRTERTDSPRTPCE